MKSKRVKPDGTKRQEQEKIQRQTKDMTPDERMVIMDVPPVFTSKAANDFAPPNSMAK
jgi:hypothetical protein